PEATVPGVDILPVEVPILYEDKDVVVINKPTGLEAHPSASTGQASTVSGWFGQRYPEAEHVGEEENRPGIVHRLDKETSGVMILAKTNTAYQHLKNEFKVRRAKKEYLALVFGIPTMKRGRVTRPLGRSPRNPLRRTIDAAGKPAITEWQIERKISKQGLAPHRRGAPGAGFALLRLFPFTGRTHQLRAHLHFLGHPIVGDKLYTFKRQRPPQGVTRQLLHAEKLTLTLPSGKRKTFIAPLPDDFARAINP
ncbi:MAG: RluA family pseudouridine synthase, partial [Patescibacteria group bacterium]